MDIPFLWISHLIPIPGLQCLRGMVTTEMEQRGFRTPSGRGPGTPHLFWLKLDRIYLRGISASDSGVAPIHFSDHNSVWVLVRAP